MAVPVTMSCLIGIPEYSGTINHPASPGSTPNWAIMPIEGAALHKSKMVKWPCTGLPLAA
ncbi:hypothetical protein CVV68_02965 [Arthrobacter livingstonensis]|uniref:Uncharacterized protein n=1 Tax=Arthrobacter livingstonensis TaxID=670078 RepID=A0A2V5LH84_9MICC|nr:hypothetical protein CVV68_02965 [Arthrobacter livingstonensis]